MVIVVAAFNLCKFLTEMGGWGVGGVTGGSSLVLQSRRGGWVGGGASGFNQHVSESGGHAHRRT